MKDITDLIQTIATLIGVLSWPLVVIFMIYYFGKPLKGIIARLGEFSFKAGTTGIEASAKIQELQEKLPAVNKNTASDARVKVAGAEKSGIRGENARTEQRHKTEERNREIYLVHVIKPSNHSGLLFDVFVYLKKHRSDDLSEIKFAEFFLGKYWDNKIFRVDNKDGLIGISISAYGPVLCTCRVVFKDGNEVMLDRYLDFEMADAVYSSNAG